MVRYLELSNFARILIYQPFFCVQSLIVPDQFQHILRVMNTNIDGKTKIMFAMTAIKGVGRRYSNIVCKKADVDISKRAGELSEEEVSLRVLKGLTAHNK